MLLCDPMYNMKIIDGQQIAAYSGGKYFLKQNHICFQLIIFLLIFAQNIHVVLKAALTSIHNLCKNKKIMCTPVNPIFTI